MVAWVWLVTSEEGVEVKLGLPNYWLQARPGFGLLFVLVLWSDPPESKTLAVER
jgi:hypothetical protein